MTETVAPEPTQEQVVLIARVRRLMLIAGLTTALALAAVLVAVGYRLYRSADNGPIAAGADVTAILPKGARIVATAVGADRLLVTIDVAGRTEVHAFDARSLRPVGTLRFADGPP